MAEVSKEELRLAADGREVADMLRSKGWAVFERVLNAQIKVRQDMLLLPSHELKHESGMLDGVSRMLAQECVKGALIGLRLALATPSAMVAQADEIRSRANSGEETNDE